MTGADMDVCLTSYGHCNYVSGKHACIFYDEVSAWVIFFFSSLDYYFYFLVCMAVGAGGAGSRLSLCGAPLVDCKEPGLWMVLLQWRLCQRFLSNPFLKHRALPARFLWADCLWARTGHKPALSLLVSRERKGHRHGLILFDLDALLIKAKLHVSTLNLNWNKPGNCSESLVFKCDGGAKHS